jgi:hypothetical protein
VTRPPKPTDYKHGDIHLPTGRIFCGYYWANKKYWYPGLYHSKTKEDAQIEIMYKNALVRARLEKLPFDIDIEYLKSIKTDRCPIFDMELAWGKIGEGHKNMAANSPSLDKIKPEYGYIKGNVCIISNLANMIKQDVGYEELYKVADWLYEKYKEVEKNVRPEQFASVPKKSRQTSKDDSQLGFIFTAGPWEDSDDANDYRGAVQGQDADHRAQAGSGDSVGHGGQEMGTSQTLDNSQMYGDTSSALTSTLQFNRHINNQLRERSLADGTKPKI